MGYMRRAREDLLNARKSEDDCACCYDAMIRRHMIPDRCEMINDLPRVLAFERSATLRM